MISANMRGRIQGWRVFGDSIKHLLNGDMVKDSRLDCQAMRQELAATISSMRDIQAELLQSAS